MLVLGLELSQSQVRQLIASCEISTTRCLRLFLCLFARTNSRVTPYKIAFQDIEAGDGTTSVCVIAGSLLNTCQGLLDKGIHPTAISEAFMAALQQVWFRCIWVRLCAVGLGSVRQVCRSQVPPPPHPSSLSPLTHSQTHIFP